MFTNIYRSIRLVRKECRTLYDPAVIYNFLVIPFGGFVGWLSKGIVIIIIVHEIEEKLGRTPGLERRLLVPDENCGCSHHMSMLCGRSSQVMRVVGFVPPYTPLYHLHQWRLDCMSGWNLFGYLEMQTENKSFQNICYISFFFRLDLCYHVWRDEWKISGYLAIQCKCVLIAEKDGITWF